MHQLRWFRLLAAGAAFVLLAAACGDDDEGGTAADEGGGQSAAGAAGGEFIELGTFVGDPPEHIDPALNTTLDAYQLINALYDGLTDIDASDPENPVVMPHVAESFEPNEDATVWTFTIRDGLEFSNGEPVLPSSFAAAWERASNPDFAGDYSYLFNFIDGGAEKLDGTADTLSGVAADDEAMTLTVTLDAPYANFDAVSGFQLFFPMPTEATEAADPAAWENGVMVGNGPYKMEEPRTDEEIVIVRNDSWGGDINGETWPDRLEQITFRVNADPDTSFNAFEAGEGHNGQVPPARATEAQENYDTTLDNAVLGSYFYTLNQRAPEIGGDENKLLRQAISQAIDRDEINTAVYNDTRAVSTGVTPIGIPGAEEGLCDYCAYDPEAAQEAFDEWTAAGNEQTEPIRIQFNADAGHEPVVQIIIDNLAAIGIEAEAEPFPTETYFTQLAEGACVFCRTGWYADYPTYDNFMYDLFHSDALDGNNYGFINEEFDALVDEAKETIDKDQQGELFREAEQILLNDEIMAIPLNFYRGDYVFDPARVASFVQNNLGLILWEQVQLAE
jgi:oligopeptide transport system substrate-binding protein